MSFSAQVLGVESTTLATIPTSSLEQLCAAIVLFVSEMSMVTISDAMSLVRYIVHWATMFYGKIDL